MKTTSDAKGSPETLLRVLAREFRGTRDVQQRTSIAQRYSQAVHRLIGSKKWQSIPPLEDQLPDEWMPAEFFEHWSLRIPPRRTANTAVIVEGKEDIAILRKVLPADVLEACEFQSANGTRKLVSHAGAHASKHHAPVVLVFDTNTLDQAVITRTVQEVRGQMASAVVGVPYDVIWFTPHIEMVFFEGTVDLKRIFPHFKDVFVNKLANEDPKSQLQALFEKGGGPKKLSDFLDELTGEDVEKIRVEEPIYRLITFITNNRAPIFDTAKE